MNPVAINPADLNGSNGFVINGIDPGDISGRSVSNAGDVNGDGIDDLIIGAPYADPNGNNRAGESYVVFGGSDVGNEGSLELSALDGSNGFVINGATNPYDYSGLSGYSVGNAGDINGDGIDDLIIGALIEDFFYAGTNYIVFGDHNVGSDGNLELSALDGSNGFVINGINKYDRSGRSVSNAGDVNGDGVDDLIIRGYRAEESYVVFGSSDVGNEGSLELSALDGSNGFVIFSGGSISNAGDINSDGIDDIIIGAPGADPNGNYRAGESYVVFGSRNLLADFGGIIGTEGNDSLEGSLNSDKIIVLGGNDTVRSLLGDDSINSGAGNDLIFGNNGNDQIFGGNDNDTLWGQRDNDIIEGDDGNDRILGNNGNDSLNGGNGSDTLFGGADNDLLVGGDGNDLIFGQNGNDNLAGGNGLDTLWGGAGSDIFNILRGGNTDRIKDYADGEDKFALGTSLTFEDLTFVKNGNTTQIRFTQNGRNIFMAAVENTNLADLDATDFLIADA